VNLLSSSPSPRETRERIGKVIMLGIVLPVGVLLVLQTTRFSLFPGRARVLWSVLDAAVFVYLLLNVLWEWMQRRQNQADARGS
jgi:hypothetical protein